MHVFAMAVGGTFPSLAAFDNAAISDDSAPGAGDLDGIGTSLSRQALSAAGLNPGQQFSDGVVSYTWPSTAGVRPDDALANGQTVAVGGAGARFGVVGLATFGTASGPLCVHYTDGSTSVSLTFADWLANGTIQVPIS